MDDQPIYLDNNLKTKLSEKTQEIITQANSRLWASPAAPYQLGEQALSEVNRVAKQIYDLVDAKEEDSLLFCSTGIEAIEKVFLSFLMDQPKGKPLQILSVEGEESFLALFLDTLDPSIAKVNKIPLSDKGELDIKAFEDYLSSSETSIDLMSLSHANRLTGVIHPIEKIASLCEKNNIPLHVDSSSVVGKVYFSFQELPIDYLTFSGDLIHGPKSGALFIKSHKKAHPWITGGEKDAFLAHKMDVPKFLGFAQSCKEAKEHLDTFSIETAFLASRFEEKIKEKISDVVFPLKMSDRLPNVSVVVFSDIPSEPFLFYLNEERLFATFGRGFAIHLAKILEKGSFDTQKSWSALSFAFSRYDTEEMIDRAVDIIVSTYEKAKRIF